MKFLEYLLKNQIPLWKDFYVNYNLLKQILKPLHKLYKAKLREVYLKKQFSSKTLPVSATTNDALVMSFTNELNDISPSKQNKQFRQQLFIELHKVEHFYKETLHKKIEPRLFEISEQLEYAKINNIFEHFQLTFESAIKELYKEISSLKDFVDLNIKAKGKIVKKYHKVIKLLSIDNKSLISKKTIQEEVDEFILGSELKNYENTLNVLFNQCSKLFAYGYGTKYKNQTNKILKTFNTKEQFTQSQSFLLGLGVGVLIFETIVILCVCFNYKLSFTTDLEFSSLAPIYRSFLLIIAYIFLLGINIYLWSKKHLAYKIFLRTQSADSDTFDFMKSSTILSLVLFTGMLLYVLVKEEVPFMQSVISLIPRKGFPILCWLLFLGYLFVPVPKLFNIEGKMYIFNLIRETIVQLKVEFRHIWLIEQTISLIGPLRGLEYTVCYYVYLPYGESLIEQRCSYNYSHIKYFIIALFPNLLRLIQSAIILRNNFYSPLIRTSQVLNIIKNTIIIFVSFLSYLTFYIQYKGFYYKLWLILVIIGTLYTGIYDMKYDFGLLHWNKYFPFRIKLHYKKYSYYLGCIMNFIFRFCFFLILSPEILNMIFRNWLQAVLSILYFTEIIRRFIWNSFRIEIKHIEVAKRFQMTNNIKLPFDKGERGEFTLKADFHCTKELEMVVRRSRKVSGIAGDEEEYHSRGEILQYESRVIGDVEDVKELDMDTFYEKELISYLKRDYYVRTINNVEGNEMIIGKVYIIDDEYIEE